MGIDDALLLSSEMLRVAFQIKREGLVERLIKGFVKDQTQLIIVPDESISLGLKAMLLDTAMKKQRVNVNEYISSITKTQVAEFSEALTLL